MTFFDPRGMRIAVALIAASALALPSVATASNDTTTVAHVMPSDSLQWMSFVGPNSEEENYLRYLQIAGAVPLYPWSLRGFSLGETRRLVARSGTHPWAGVSSFRKRSPRATWIPLGVELRHNTAFPYGSNDGPVWAGRGLTGSVSGGFAARFGPLSLVLAPMAFVTQNASFDLLDNGASGPLRFGDGLYAGAVDRPQRFGEKAYGRIDPGNSTLRLDAGVFAAGISTANMAWGPFELYPYVLGTNAPGFAHGFVGTARPVNVWLGSLHGRIVWGRLDQSEYSPVVGEATYVSLTEPGTRRFASGLVLLFEPRGVQGLELGVARFFHSPWPREGVPPSYFRKPFENILKNRLKGAPGFSDPGTSADNQLISGFARWAFPSVGFEMYAEYGREDHSWDKRDFVQEPDHSRSYGLGLRKTFRLNAERLDGLAVELINFQLPHLARTGRFEGGIYMHNVMRQGHTHRGQLLGSDAGINAASGSSLRWDRYRPRGRASLSFHRIIRQERGSFFADGSVDPRSSDVQYAVEAVRVRPLRSVEVAAGIAVVHGLNRNFQKDVTNVSAQLGFRIPLEH